MTVTRLVITGTWVTETDTPASGRIQFQANDVGFVNGGELVRAGVQGYALDKTGSINVSLIRCPDGYTVTEQINGAYKRSYILPDQVGPVDLRDVIVTPTGINPAALVAAEAVLRQQGDIAEQDAREAQFAALESALDGTYVPIASKGAASGVATLNALSRIPGAQLPAGQFPLADYYGGGTPGTLAGDTAAMRAAVAAASADAKGGEVLLPAGALSYDLSTGPLVFPLRINGAVTMSGAGMDKTRITCSGALPGGEKYFIRHDDSYIGGSTRTELKNMRIQGPVLISAPGTGSESPNLRGVRVEAGMRLERVIMAGWYAAVVPVGDHMGFRECVLGGANYYGVYMDEQVSDGDLVFDGCDLSGASFASIGVSPTGSLQGATFLQGHIGFAPYCIYVETGTRTFAPVAVGSALFLATSFEGVGNAVIYDAGFASGGGGGIFSGLAFYNCGNFQSYPARALPATTYDCPFVAGSAIGWRFVDCGINTFGGVVYFFDVGQMTAIILKGSVDVVGGCATAATAGIPFARAKNSAGRSYFEYDIYSQAGFMCKTSDTAGVTRRQAVCQHSEAKVAPMAAGRIFVGFALTTAPAGTTTTSQAVAVVQTSGRFCPVTVDANGGGSRSIVGLSPADPTKVRSYAYPNVPVGLVVAGETLATGDMSIELLPGQIADDPSVPITQQAANYTLVLTDAGTEVEGTKATAQTVTVPPNSSVAFPLGTVVNVRQYGAGQITITAGAGVTLRTPIGAKTRVIYSTVSLVKRGTDEWIVGGDAAA